jgi:hypothetical protein
MSNPLPTVADMAANIVAVCSRASGDQIRDGADWYDAARRMVRVIAQASGRDDETVAFVIAALSPRNPWAWNVADAYHYCMAANRGDPMPILHGERDPWAGTAPKVRAFVRAIMGDTNAVVIDVWAARAATLGEIDYVGTLGAYRQMTEAYEIAAREIGYCPIVTQAIAWVVTMGEGKNAKRGPKKGTPSLIINALACDPRPAGSRSLRDDTLTGRGIVETNPSPRSEGAE